MAVAPDFGVKRIAERKRLAARRAENMRRSPTGQVIETYYPDTFAGTLYDALGRAAGGVPSLFGGSEDTALRTRLKTEQTVRDLAEAFYGPEDLERTGKRILGGQGGVGDYLVAGLAAVPLLPKPVKKAIKKLAVRGGKKIAHVAGMAVPDAVKRWARTQLGPDMDPGLIEGSFSVRPGDPAPLSVRPQLSNTRQPRAALPAPPMELTAANNIGPLALPQPGPGLPPLASKPRGGQWWWNDPEEMLGNNSPEAAAYSGAQTLSMSGWRPEREGVFAGYTPDTAPAQAWLEKALTKYYKTDFGSPDDPLRSLAERGMHYDPDMTPERWAQTVDSHLLEDRIGDVMFPPNWQGGMPGAGDDLRGRTLAAMPWLAKQPVTDSLYGISGGGLDLSHFADEFQNALDARASGLPADLAVRPESLGRMSFPQAVEHVGKINQYRAKEMERAALSNLDSPAVHTFKEYPENNPMGLRWTELRKPDEVPEGYSVRQSEDAPRAGWWGAYGPDGRPIAWGPTEHDARHMAAKTPLQDALKYEGDTMGHCVGGYCDDVMSGKSRIFSLRDAKGEPHVTIETSPRASQSLSGSVLNDWEPGAFKRYLAQRYEDGGTDSMHDWARANFPERMFGEDIVQIKGKQNRAPKDDYLPFVQDFVKSSKWGDVGDLRNTGLVKLPDGRYITEAQYAEGLRRGREAHPDGNPALAVRLNWRGMAPHFEGYAFGGRVSADRCFSRHPLSAKG